MARFVRLTVVLAAGLGLTACTLGPDYAPPQPAAPIQWTAPLPHGGNIDGLIGWWDRLGDPVLPQLLRMAEADSPSLAQAWANIRKARATLTTSRSAGLPSVSGNGSAQRARTQADMDGTNIGNTISGSLDASWEIDLWGKVRRNAQAAEARIQARTDDWHDARVSLAAEVADTYVQYRACRLLANAYADETQSQQSTAQATGISMRAGFTSSADNALAQASAASSRATLTEQQAECDVLVKSLVDLTGAPETVLRPLLAQASEALPQPSAFAVESVPATALAQRPDLASIERELAAASAEIGAAVADRLPSLSLAGSITRSGTDMGSLLTTWAIGPAVSLPLFDAGKRAAAVDSAQATFEYQSATYRQGVRTALKEVEQALVRLDGATRRTGDSQTAAQGYRQYFDSIDSNWRAGGASLLDREQARRDALSAEISFITVQRDQIQYWIALYKALGGGWQPGTPALAPVSSGEPS